MASRRGSPNTSKWSIISLTPSRSSSQNKNGPSAGPVLGVRPTRLRRERRAASTTRLRAGVLEREPSCQPLLHVVERRAVEVQVALLVHDDLDAVDLELLVVRPDLAVELQRVREPRAPPALDAHPQEDSVGQTLGPLELPHLLGRGFGQRHRHTAPPALYVEDAAAAPSLIHFVL